METNVIRRKGIIELQLQDPMPEDTESPVVAFMKNYEGSAYWLVYDIRLSPFDYPSPFADLEASRVRCRLKPKSAAEREQVIAHLKEFQEADDGTLHWSTFDGIVHGVSVIPGQEPLLGRLHAPAIYMSYSDAMATLQGIREAWRSYQGDPAEFKIRNPYYQPDRHELVQLLDRPENPAYSSEHEL
jgi:hypothetical protein